MKFEMGMEDFKVGQMVVYFNGGDSHLGPVEIGVIKSLRDDGAFVAYHCGDTVAKTGYNLLLPVSNDYAAEALVQRMKQLGREIWPLPDGCEVWNG